MMQNKLFKISSARDFLIALLFISFLPNNAHAYIDPGSGSMILQLLLAGVAGIGMFCKLYWRRVCGFFKKSQTSQIQNPK